MTIRRAVLSGLLAFGAAGLPGCATGFSTTRTTDVPPSPVPQSRRTQFADVIRVPGQHVPLSPEREPDVTDPPDMLPPVKPGPTEQPPPTVQKPVDPPLVAAVREYLAGRPDLAADHLRQLDRATYDQLSQLLPAVVKLSQTPPALLDPKDAADILRQFDPTLAVVARRAPLRVEKAVFCKDVKGYGQFDPMPERAAFKHGEMYILYFEVGNVPNEPEPRGGADLFVTRLACSVQVRDDAGRAVELTDQDKQPKPVLKKTKEDFSRSPVRDYFAVFWFRAPSKSGTYSVTFEVRDPATARAVSQTLPFRVQ